MQYIYSSHHNKIAVEDLNPQEKAAIVLVHGWPLSHKIFEYQVNRLIDEGFRVTSIDLRGFGKSDVTAGGYDYSSLATDIYRVIEGLHIKKCCLTGFSMGGAIVIRYMSVFKGARVTKLALLGAAAPSFTQRPDFPYGMTREDVDNLIQETYRDRPQMAAEFGKMLFAKEHSESLKEWFRDISWSASGIGTIATAKSLRDEDLRPDLKAVKVPTGIFHGKKDQVCPYALAEVLHKCIAGSKLYPFEESGHALFIDELDKFNKEFIQFLKE